MEKRKVLYESIDALNQRVSSLQDEIFFLKTTDLNSRSEINPQIINRTGYISVLRSADKIQACSRYIANLPEINLASNKIECLFYDYGSLCFFKDENDVLITSYSKTGELNSLGDLTEIIPIDFAGKTHTTHRVPVYTAKKVDNPCVIINDYTGTYLNEKIYPRAALNMVSIQDQAAIYIQLKNSVLLTAKKAMALIDNQTKKEAVGQALADFFKNDSPIGVLVGQLADSIKMINLDTKVDFEGYMQAIETYEKIRANFNGIQTKSPLEKKERLIQSEVQSNSFLTNVYLYDGLINRQVGVDLMIKHKIISAGSYELNPIFCNENKENENKEKENGE